MTTDGETEPSRLLSRRIPRSYRPNELALLVDERRRAGRPLLDLTESNPTRVGLSELDAGARAALVPEALSRYEPDPKGWPEARAAVADYLTERAGLSGRPLAGPFDPGAIVLTAGTSEAYAHLFRLLCDPGDRVLAPRPSYPLFAPLAATEGVELATYRLVYDGRWRPDFDSLEAALGPRTRALIAVEPNNPTASALRPDEAEAILTLCERAGVSLISDEVFGDFPWPPRDAPLPGLLGGGRVPTFVLGGISKLCGLPQLKLGWIAVAGPERARREALQGLEWIADLFLSVGRGVELALPRLLAGRGPFRERAAARIRENLATLDRVSTESAAFERLLGDGGWTAVLRVRDAGGRELGGPAAVERGVYLHPGHFYDLPDDRYAAVSLLPDPARFREAVDRLAAG
jgi:aspartate/methionine/tyrosine aminotransferase